MKTKILIFLFLLSGCAVNKNTAELDKLRNLAIESALIDTENFTKEERILQHYERANVEWVDSSGNVVKSYNHSERKLGLLSYLPLLSFLLPRNYENYEIIVTLKNNSVLDVQSFHGIITLESESDCNEAIFSCVTKTK